MPAKPSRMVMIWIHIVFQTMRCTLRCWRMHMNSKEHKHNMPVSPSKRQTGKHKPKNQAAAANLSTRSVATNATKLVTTLQHVLEIAHPLKGLGACRTMIWTHGLLRPTRCAPKNLKRAKIGRNYVAFLRESTSQKMLMSICNY